MADAIETAVEKVSDHLSVADAQSKNALKKELKKKQKEEEKRNKNDEKKKKAATTPEDNNDMDPTQYFENRIKYYKSLKLNGLNPYPHQFHVSIIVKEFIQKYTSLNDGEHLKDVEVNIAGRTMNKRTSSSKLYFYDLFDDDVTVQVMADARDSDLDEVEFSRLHASVKRGDHVGICGYPGKSKKGELSVFPKKFVVLSYCFHMLPLQKSASGGDKSSNKKQGVLGLEWR